MADDTIEIIDIESKLQMKPRNDALTFKIDSSSILIAGGYKNKTT